MTLKAVAIKIKTFLAVTHESPPENAHTPTLSKLVTDHIALYINLKDMHSNPDGFYEQLKTSWHQFCDLLQLPPQQYYDETLNSFLLVRMPEKHLFRIRFYHDLAWLSIDENNRRKVHESNSTDRAEEAEQTRAAMEKFISRNGIGS